MTQYIAGMDIVLVKFTYSGERSGEVTQVIEAAWGDLIVERGVQREGEVTVGGYFIFSSIVDFEGVIGIAQSMEGVTWTVEEDVYRVPELRRRG